MSSLSGSIAVPANALSVVVPVAPAMTLYTPLVTPSWTTATGVAQVTPGNFTVVFSIPAPPGALLFFQIQPGAALGAPQGQLETLGSYLDDLRRLLHDPNDVYWPLSDKVVYINKGMQARDRDTLANRQHVPFTLTIGQETYTFQDLGNAQVIDVVGIALLFQSTRVVLNNLSYTLLTASYRAWKTYRGIPEAWARYGPSTIWLGPTPSVAYDTEWDVAVYAPRLVNLTDVDPLPFPYTSPVPFYGAYWAKYNERQLPEAEEFKAQYDSKVLEATNSRVGMTTSVYGTDFVRVW